MIKGHGTDRHSPTALMYLYNSRPVRFRNIDEIYYDDVNGTLTITALADRSTILPVGTAGNMEFSIRDLAFDKPLKVMAVSFPNHGEVTVEFAIIPYV